MADSEDSGGRPDVVEDLDVLELLDSSDDPVMSAPELAEQTRIGDRGMYKKLRRMQDDGLVDSKKVGRARVWWMTEEGENYLQGGDTETG
jgi:DNA-binding PadR family transcriptional regulator